jgi:nitrogen regulatory protein PII
MLKMVMIVYNEALDLEVMEVLGKCSTQNYTKVTGVFGKGNASGTHLGNDIWPGRNSILYVACDQTQAQQMLDCVKELHKKLGHEGIKAFLLPLEEIT